MLRLKLNHASKRGPGIAPYDDVVEYYILIQLK